MDLHPPYYSLFSSFSRFPFNISVPADLLKNTGVTNDVPSFDALLIILALELYQMAVTLIVLLKD